MRESVPTARYSPVCNVLRQWKTSLILTYRVYRLYDISININNNYNDCIIYYVPWIVHTLEDALYNHIKVPIACFKVPI